MKNDLPPTSLGVVDSSTAAGIPRINKAQFDHALDDFLRSRNLHTGPTESQRWDGHGKTKSRKPETPTIES